MDAKYCECQKVLLNLKWFVKHLCRMFEDRLQRSVTQTHPSHINATITNKSSMNCNRAGTPNSQGDSDCPTPQNGGSTNSLNKSHKKWSTTRHSLTNSPLLRRLVKAVPPLIGGTPNRKMAPINATDSRTARLVLLTATTTENERELNIKQFGEHICVVYEYQIGMLENLSSVNLLATFVACLLIKLIKNGIVESLSPDALSLCYLLQPDNYPRSFLNKSVKTMSIGVSNNYLNWNLKNIFTHPGLRYNHVGGENCSNLTIVTQLLCGKTQTGDFRRPDIFGYRNLICHRQVAGPHYVIEPTDQKTIDEAHTSDSLIKSSTETLMDHLHKCYKSIFFVVLDRTVIIDHLLNCQSFRTFCLRELITPVLFVNVYNEDLSKNNDKRLFQNFNLFHISVTSKPLQNPPTASASSSSTNNTSNTSTTAAGTTKKSSKSSQENINNSANNSSNLKSSSSNNDDIDDETSSFCSECRILSKVYDNHAFMC